MLVKRDVVLELETKRERVNAVKTFYIKKSTLSQHITDLDNRIDEDNVKTQKSD